MAIAENYVDDSSIKYNAWLDLPPPADEIMFRLGNSTKYRLAADKFVTYLQSYPNAELVNPAQLLTLGKSLEMEVKFEQALAVYALHSVQFPEQVGGWMAQARLEKKRGNLTRALVLFQEASVIDPNCQQIEYELDYIREDLQITK